MSISFADYQTQLEAINDAIDASDFPSARIALAKARVLLAGMPDEIVTGQQTTKFRAGSDLDKLDEALTAAESGGCKFGLFKTRRAFG